MTLAELEAAYTAAGVRPDAILIRGVELSVDFGSGVWLDLDIDATEILATKNPGLHETEEGFTDLPTALARVKAWLEGGT